MVFIGDFVPNIIALIFPENWAQDTKGNLAARAAVAVRRCLLSSSGKRRSYADMFHPYRSCAGLIYDEPAHQLH